MEFDVIVVGAGPAGLSAALMLGRCGRSVVVLDANEPRNAASPALHGFLTRDGTPPMELRAAGGAELARYPSVKLRRGRVLEARGEAGEFEVVVEGSETLRSRLLLLATGRADPVPALPGFAEYFGRGVHHCPYCDGWEHRDRALGVFGGDQDALDLAHLLSTWSRDVTIYSHGAPRWKGSLSGLTRVIPTPIAALRGTARLAEVALVGGTILKCDALFFPTPCVQRSSLPEQLGCAFAEDESVRCSGHRAEGVEGLFVAGNVRGGAHLAITAAAEGAEAAIAMNAALLAAR